MSARSVLPVRAGLLALIAWLGSVATVSAEPAFSPCPQPAGFSCATLTVPLDPSNQVPGSIRLSLRRLPAGPAPSPEAVVALAGGPGQAAQPLSASFQRLLKPALVGRDLLVFDQRGTGASDPLRCASLGNPRLSLSATVSACAQELGAARAVFTTPDSVADIEALRRALGYQRLVLVGTSYGTKVALAYAAAHPQNVAALVLDSVVVPAGPDPFARSSFAAMGRVLGDLCSAGACRSTTSNPLADLAALVRRMARHQLRGSAYDGHGRRHVLALGRGDLLNVLLGGDENPALRAELPAALRAALAGDAPPLLRLALLAAGLVPDEARPAGVPGAGPRLRPWPARSSALGARALAASPSAAFDQTLYLTTTCEELSFPWDRAATVPARERAAIQAANRLPASAVAPFDQTTALVAGLIPTCLGWPDSGAAAGAPPPLPPVPTLILSGSADLRTPTEDARSVAASIPGAQLLVVPHTGHSVLGTDLSACSSSALSAFFAGTAVAACAATPNFFRPTPVPPVRLGAVPPAAGVAGRAGRTLNAVSLTLVDLRRQIIGAILELNQNLPSGSRLGGLRGGYAELVGASVRLHRFAYIPGVLVSGTITTAFLLHDRGRGPRLSVEGAAAARGRLVLVHGGRESGVLGGHRVSARAARSAVARSSRAAAWYAGAGLASPDRALGRAG